jgi:hypothetical protein
LRECGIAELRKCVIAGMGECPNAELRDCEIWAAATNAGFTKPHIKECEAAMKRTIG